MDDFKRIIDSSDIIVLAKPTYINFKRTEFEVTLSYKGKAPSTVSVNHISEVHDQRINYVGRHILFLRNNKGGIWEATSYGRSYWPLLNSRNYENHTDNSCATAIPKIYPFTMVSMVGHVKATMRKVYFNNIPHEKNGVEMEVFCKEDVEKFIENHLTR